MVADTRALIAAWTGGLDVRRVAPERRANEFPLEPGAHALPISVPRAVRKPRRLRSKPGFEGKGAFDHLFGHQSGRRLGTQSIEQGITNRLACGSARVSLECRVRAQAALAAQPRSASCAHSRACCCSSGVASRVRRAPQAEPTTCFKIKEVLGVSMCTEKLIDEESRCGRAHSDEEVCYQLRGKFGKSRDVDHMVLGHQVGQVG